MFLVILCFQILTFVSCEFLSFTSGGGRLELGELDLNSSISLQCNSGNNHTAPTPCSNSSDGWFCIAAPTQCYGKDVGDEIGTIYVGADICNRKCMVTTADGEVVWKGTLTYYRSPKAMHVKRANQILVLVFDMGDHPVYSGLAPAHVLISAENCLFHVEKSKTAPNQFIIRSDDGCVNNVKQLNVDFRTATSEQLGNWARSLEVTDGIWIPRYRPVVAEKFHMEQLKKSLIIISVFLTFLIGIALYAYYGRRKQLKIYQPHKYSTRNNSNKQNNTLPCSKHLPMLEIDLGKMKINQAKNQTNNDFTVHV